MELDKLSKDAETIVKIAPTFVETWNLTKRFILSNIFLPSLIA